MELAIRSFMNNTPSGSRIFIIGDMFELGEHEPEAHRELIVLLEKSTAPGDTVLCIGPRLYAQKNNIFHFYEKLEDAKKLFLDMKKDGTFILLKGSRGMKLENMLE
jgi:UDP-N-acetylmuramoyl-tripeptide--D-alanyl-D-alanine ligase